MKGMILAAGFGTRLAPHTELLPKALVPVAGEPMIRHAVDALLRAGCDEIVVNTHHFAGQVEEYFRTNDFGVSIHVLREAEILGTGGGLLNAASLLEHEDIFLLWNADIASAAQLSPLIEALDASADGGVRPLASLLVNRRDTRRALLFDAGMRFLGKEAWAEEGLRVPADVQRCGFCGVHAIRGEFFRLGIEEGFHDIFDLYRRGMARGHALTGVVTEAYWTDLGTPERIAAHERYLRGA